MWKPRANTILTVFRTCCPPSHTHTRTRAHTHTHTHTRTYARMHACTHAHACTHTQDGSVTTVNELHLFSVTNADSGTYQCTANNELGTDTASATLTISSESNLVRCYIKCDISLEFIMEPHFQAPPSRRGSWECAIVCRESLEDIMATTCVQNDVFKGMLNKNV